jgi:BioD-like phosphotransacetylase family protein
MIGLYIGSTSGYSGKNLLALALCLRFREDGLRVGYMKPVGAMPRLVDGELGDDDALFINGVLGLGASPADMTPVPVTKDFLMKAFAGECGVLMPAITAAYHKLAVDKDVMIVGGSGSYLYSGTYCGVDGVSVARSLGAKTLIVDRYRSELNYDYLAAAKQAAGDDLAGVVLNDVPEHFRPEVDELIKPFLARRGIDVLGVIPHDPVMSGMRAGDLAERLGGRLVTMSAGVHNLVVNFLIGAMNVENFLAFFRKRKDVAVICGGDRSDLQLVALEGGAAALVLTGNLYPNDIILTKAEAMGVPVILARDDTFSVAKKMETLLFSEKLRDPTRVAHGARLIGQALDYAALTAKLGLA